MKPQPDKTTSLFMEVLRLHVSQYYGSGDYQAKLDALDTVIKADPFCESVEATLPHEN